MPVVRTRPRTVPALHPNFVRADVAMLNSAILRRETLQLLDETVALLGRLNESRWHPGFQDGCQIAGAEDHGANGEALFDRGSTSAAGSAAARRAQ